MVLKTYPSGNRMRITKRQIRRIWPSSKHRFVVVIELYGAAYSSTLVSHLMAYRSPEIRSWIKEHK